MIELRWLEREALFMSNGAVPVPTTERVLQYRTWQSYAGADGNLHPCHSKFEPIWTDWRDVPVEMQP